MRDSIDGVAGACGVAALLFITTAAAAPAYDHHIRLTPENSAIGNFPRRRPPILTVKSGDRESGYRRRRRLAQCQGRSERMAETERRTHHDGDRSAQGNLACWRRRRATRASRMGTC